jgi:hypothetical protein
MKMNQINAKITGILFILGTTAPIFGGLLTAPIMESQDYLKNMASHQTTMIISIITILIMGLACAGISIAMYPILKKYRAAMALGAVGYRLMEGLLAVLVATCTSALLMISTQFVSADASSALQLQSLANLILSVKEWILNGPLLICWIIGAALYYTIFYQFNLVPRWLSLWGLIGITLTFFSSIFVMISPNFGTLQTICSLPILVQELVLAVWLIVKGFSIPENTTTTTK